MTLGQRIREERETRGWTQIELGRILGVTGTAVNRYEADARRPDPETLARLADLFRVSVDYLLGRTPGSAPAGRESSPEIRALLRAVRGMTPEARHDIMDYVAWKREQARKAAERDEASPATEPEPPPGTRG